MNESTTLNMADIFPNAPNTPQAEDGNRFDRARMGYFANRTIVDDILSATTNEVLLAALPAPIIVRSILAFNDAASATTVFIKFVPPGVAAGSWLPMFEYELDIKETKIWKELDNVLEAGTVVCAWASAGDEVLLKINGLNVVGQ